MKTIYIASNNPYKIKEVTSIAKTFNIKVEGYPCDIRELQTNDRKQLIRHKTLEAFSKVRYPVLVDHASLEIECLNNMPGTLTQLFWDKLEGKICDIVSCFGVDTARAISTVAYCDGKNIYDEEGVVEGKIAAKPYLSKEFQWDTIFIPNGETRTYAEIRAIDDNAIDIHRKLAFDKLLKRISSL